MILKDIGLQTESQEYQNTPY